MPPFPREGPDRHRVAPLPEDCEAVRSRAGWASNVALEVCVVTSHPLPEQSSAVSVAAFRAVRRGACALGTAAASP
jgi:hypothetical protein